MTLESGRLREAFTADPGASRPRDDCPTPEDLFAAVKMELSVARRRDIIDHTALCPSCAEDWRLACELSPVVVEPGTETPSVIEQLAWLWRSPSILGAVAAVVVAVSIGFFVLRQPEEPIYRDPGGSLIRSLIAEDEPLARDRCLLRWSAGPEGARYDLMVTTEQLVSVARFEGLETTEVLIPEEALRDLPDGARLLWQLSVRTPDGSRFTTETFVSALE